MKNNDDNSFENTERRRLPEKIRKKKRKMAKKQKVFDEPEIILNSEEKPEDVYEPESAEPKAENKADLQPEDMPSDEESEAAAPEEYEEKNVSVRRRREGNPQKPHRKRRRHSKAKEKAIKRQRMCDSIYIFFAFILFAGITAAMLILPRSTVSALEKRNLEKFPEFSAEAYFKGDYTDGISTYFSDTVPFRDELMTLSTLLTDKRGIKTNITIHGTAAVVNSGDEEISESEENGGGGSETVSEEPVETTEVTTEYTNQQIADAELADLSDEKYTVVNNGIAVVGTRALMLY